VTVVYVDPLKLPSPIQEGFDGDLSPQASVLPGKFFLD